MSTTTVSRVEGIDKRIHRYFSCSKKEVPKTAVQNGYRAEPEHIFSRSWYFLERYLCCRKRNNARKDIMSDAKYVPVPHYSRPGRRQSLKPRPSIDPDIQATELDADQILFLIKEKAAKNIQRIARGYLARLFCKRLWDEAMEQARLYWQAYAARIQWEREKRRIEARVIAEMSRKIVNKVISDVSSHLVRTYAAITIQRYWRGYQGRRVVLVKHTVRVRPPPSLTRRFGHDILRRVWVRRRFEPAGGWPGKSDVIEYNMWDYTDKAPKGRSYGLTTHKIRGTPANQKEHDILTGDRNAWYGLPVSVAAHEEASMSQPAHVKAFLEASPYAIPLGGQSSSSKRTKVSYDTLGWDGYVGEPFVEPSGGVTVMANDSEIETEMEGMSSLPRRVFPTRGAYKPTSASATTHSRQSSSRQLVTRSAHTQYSPSTTLRSPSPSPLYGSSSSIDPSQSLSMHSHTPASIHSNSNNIHTYSGMNMNMTMTAPALMLSTTTPITSAMPMIMTTKKPSTASHISTSTSTLTSVPVHWKTESQAIVRKRTAAAASWTPKTTDMAAEAVDMTGGTGSSVPGPWSGSSWSRLKARSAAATAATTPSHNNNSTFGTSNYPSGTGVGVGTGIGLGTAMGPGPGPVESRAKVWPSVKKEHFHLKYTWVPQPLVQTAVRQIYSRDPSQDMPYDGEEEEEEEDDGSSSFPMTMMKSTTLQGGKELSQRSTAAASLEDIEQAFRDKSQSYYALESDLLSKKGYSTSLTATGGMGRSIGCKSSTIVSVSTQSYKDSIHPYHFL
eukprot:gene2666-5234_t